MSNRDKGAFIACLPHPLQLTHSSHSSSIPHGVDLPYRMLEFYRDRRWVINTAYVYAWKGRYTHTTCSQPQESIHCIYLQWSLSTVIRANHDRPPPLAMIRYENKGAEYEWSELSCLVVCLFPCLICAWDYILGIFTIVKYTSVTFRIVDPDLQTLFLDGKNRI